MLLPSHTPPVSRQAMERPRSAPHCRTNPNNASARASIGLGGRPKPPCRWSVTSCSRSEEHTSELQSLMRISYAVFCLKKKKHHHLKTQHNTKYNIYHKPQTI